MAAKQTNNKTTKIIYWVATVLLALFVLPGVFYLNSEMAKEGMLHIGAPARLGHLVGYGQPLGMLLVLLPWTIARLKEWAYVGLGIIYIGALYAHLVVDGFVWMSFTPVITFALLLISYITRHKLIDTK